MLGCEEVFLGVVLRQIYVISPISVLEALAILEAAILECKKRNVKTPEVKAALDLLEPYVWPKWVVPQFRHHVDHDEREPVENREGQQQVLRATFPGIRDCVRELLRVRLDRLALKFHQTKDLKISDEIYRLAGEHSKLKEPWKFVAR